MYKPPALGIHLLLETGSSLLRMVFIQRSYLGLCSWVEAVAFDVDLALLGGGLFPGLGHLVYPRSHSSHTHATNGCIHICQHIIHTSRTSTSTFNSLTGDTCSHTKLTAKLRKFLVLVATWYLHSPGIASLELVKLL